MALNDKKRKMIDTYLKGSTKKEAMLAAGYSKGVAETRHSIYFGDEDVVAEISRRQKIAAARTDISLENLNKQLMEIASASLGDLISVDENGSMSMDYTKMTPELKRAMSNLTIDEVTEGRGPEATTIKRIRIGTLDRIRAIELLIRHNGLSKEKVTVNVESDLVERLHRGRMRVAASEPVTEDEP